MEGPDLQRSHRPGGRFSAAVCFAVVLVASHSCAIAAGRSTPPKDIDRYVSRVLQTFEVPGLALAIVKDGKVVLAKGYGERRIGDATRVDAQTIFPIASNTKAFTATALGILVEEGKVEWDTPVVRYLPWFALGDPYVTRELTVRDLLVHRSGLGLGAGDLLWWPPSTYDRKEIARRLRYLPLATSFRSTYAYDNVLYLVAGEVIEAVSGKTWEEFVRERVLEPVGMTGSGIGLVGVPSTPNVAAPHARVDGKVRAIEAFTSANTNPAGGIESNAADMAKWMITQLDSGRVAGGKRIFSPRTTRELWAPVTLTPIGDAPRDLPALRRNFSGYALGFGVNDYRGRKLLSHTGGLPGYLSRVTLLPDLGLGIAVLTNQESGAAYNAIVYRVLDHYLGVSDTDWLAGFAEMRRKAQMQAQEEAPAKRDSTSGPSLPPEKYAGTYTDLWYGDVTIERESGKLVMRFTHTPVLVGDLEHWQHDTFVVRWRDRTLRADAFVTFALNPDGSIDQVKMQPISDETDFSYDFSDLLLRPAPGEKKP